MLISSRHVLQTLPEIVFDQLLGALGTVKLTHKINQHPQHLTPALPL